MIYREADPPRSCPECRDGLRRIASGDRFSCDRCMGIWVDLHTLRALWEGVGDVRRWPGMDALGKGQLPCALCATPMDSVVLDALILHRCAHHGVWLDRHEIGRISIYEDPEVVGDSQRLVDAMLRRPAVRGRPKKVI